jgi:hypothetical protein
MGEQETQLESAQLGRVEVVSFSSDVVTVRTSTPRPPGTRVDLAEPGASAPLAQGKVIGVRQLKTATALWDVEVKLFAPTRSARARLAELAAPHP